MAENLAGRAAVVQINTQENQILAARFGVRSIPFLVLLKNGRPVAELRGAQTVDAILAWMRNHS